MKNFIQPGDVLDLTAPLGGVVSGGVYQIGQLLVVAGISAEADAPFTGKTTGVFGVTKVGTQAWTVGALVYWDDANSRFTTDPTGGLLAGHAVEAVGAGANETAGVVRLDGAARDNEAT